MAMGKIVTFHSAKGGVGKSSLARNFSVFLADKGHKVAIYETCVGGNLNKMMGVFSDVTASSGISPKEVLLEQDEYKVSLMAHGQKIVIDEEEKTMSTIITYLKQSYDYVLIDTDHWISLSNYIALTSSDCIVLVGDYNPNALYRLVERYELLVGSSSDNGMGIDREKIFGFINKTYGDKSGIGMKYSFPIVEFEFDEDYRRITDTTQSAFIAKKNDVKFNNCMDSIFNHCNGIRQQVQTESRFSRLFGGS